MIISASRRTDIPAFYSEWFMNRLRAGFVYVRHPWNPRRLTRVDLQPDQVDCIVFWTKNARPMLDCLKLLDVMGYFYYFQFTITPYDSRIETKLPPKAELIKTFQQLSKQIGRQRVVWRYDPVIVSSEFSVAYHLEQFAKMAGLLRDYTEQCIFSFMDLYPKVRRNVQSIAGCRADPLQAERIVRGFAETAQSCGFSLAACSEAAAIGKAGIGPASCIDWNRIEAKTGSSVRAKKDSGQRPDCRCIDSTDIGAYDCCSNGCIYCYAKTNDHTVCRNRKMHDPQSPMLIGGLHGTEVITAGPAFPRKMKQLNLF